MFKVGQILKTNLAKAEAEYAQWKGSQVYATMIANAQKYTFEVISVTDTSYILKRNDGYERTAAMHEVHNYFVLDDNGGENKP